MCNDKALATRGVTRGVPGVLGPPNPIPLKIMKDKTCTHYACTAHLADRTMNVLNELRIT